MTKVFCAALRELIHELKQKNSGTQQFILEDGKRLSEDVRGYSYQFEFTEEANLFESAKVVVLIGGKRVAGQITGLFQGQIIVTLEEDFGPEIISCVLRIDNTALLQALHDRLEEIEDGASPAFRSDFATAVIQNRGTARPPAAAPDWPWRPLPNSQQQDFVRCALANEITWLWGPPGTGKTDVLAVLARLQFQAGKRVLVCSNTNQAVDQLLLKFCQKMKAAGETALEEGRVLRLGRIEHDELRNSFEELITVEGIVARRSKELTERKQAIEDMLIRIKKAVAHAKMVLELFATLDAAVKGVEKAEAALQNELRALRVATTAAQEAKSYEHRLQQELLSVQGAGVIMRFFLRGEDAIRRDLRAAAERITSSQQRLEAVTVEVARHRQVVDELRAGAEKIRAELVSEDRGRLRQKIQDAESRSAPLRAELAQIVQQLDLITSSVLKDARVVGATATRTFLRPIEFSEFDTVIIDEASMILLPAVFHSAGLAKERVVVSGDFRQLPPIVQTEQEAIFRVLGHDVFTRAGITNAVEQGAAPPRLVMLQQQYRMDDGICRLISVAPSNLKRNWGRD